MNPPVSPERAAQIRRLFDAVVELAPAERARRLDREDDPTLRREVESLLAAYDRADEVLHALEPPTAAAADPLVGRQVSHYQITEKLGGGGMGVVYKARDLKLGRTVALKFLPPHLSVDEEAKARLIAEAQAASALDHPHIAVVHEIGETKPAPGEPGEGRLFIAMTCYEGETLKKKIARGPLPVEETVAYAVQMAEGLQRAHEAGIVHRDVKPANVMVTERGRVKLVDFGLAKVQDVSLTRTGTTLGTVAYMSPEQARGEAVDHRTDLWSLGVVLYELLTAKRPFRGEHAEAILYALRHEEPEPVRVLRPEVPEAVSQVVEKLLRKNPEERYGQADEVLADLGVPHRGRQVVPPETRPAPSARRSRALRYGGVGLMGLVLAFAGYFSFTGGGAPLDSIAVLPLQNLTGNPAKEYVADGMTDLLINNLSRLSGLDRVISRTSIMQYKGTDKSMREIGRELGVDALVEASVLSDSEQVIVTVNLIEAGTERGLWGQRYERPLRDVLKVQSEIALAIAQEISVALTPQEKVHLTQAPEVDPAVYDLYIKGLQVRVNDAHARQQAIDYFEQAIALDSSFAPAYAALAIEYALEGGMDLQPGLEINAAQLAKQALALDPSLSEPYVALGLLRELVDWDWAGAEEALLKAIERNPGDAFAHHELGQLLMRLGRFEEALAREKQALYLDPLSARYQSGLGEVYLYSGQYDQAIIELDKAYAMHPPLGAYYLGHAYWQKGLYEEALRWWKALGPRSTEVIEVGLARYKAMTGQRDQALAMLRDMEGRWAQGDGVLYYLWNIATLHADLGEKDQALDWLERAYEARLGFLVYLNVDPVFYSLHGEPRFQALLEKMGLD